MRAALAAMLFAAGLAPVGAVAATRSTKADVTIVTPLSLIKDEDLDYIYESVEEFLDNHS